MSRSEGRRFFERLVLLRALYVRRGEADRTACATVAEVIAWAEGELAAVATRLEPAEPMTSSGRARR